MTRAAPVWNPRRVGELVTLTSGESPSGFTFGPIGTPYYKVEQLGRSQKYLGRNSTPYFSVGLPCVPAGSVLIAKRGGAIALNRVRLTTEPSFMDTNVMALTPSIEIDSEFLYYWLGYRGLWDIADVTSVPQINNKHINPLEIALPSLAVQRAIAGALRGADELIAVLERMIRKMEAIKQGMMQQLLTGKTRLPGFADKWHSLRLGDVLSYEQPGRFLVQTTKQLELGRVPVLTAGKTFVLGYTNETHGVYTDHPVIIFDDFTTDTKFVNFDFKAKSSAMKILSARSDVALRFIYERMQLLDFPLGDHKRHWISECSTQELDVPDFAEQSAISLVITDCDDEIDLLKRRLAKARAAKTGMMQELFTGHTRLVAAEGAA